MRPVIGITGRRKKGHQIAGMIDSLHEFDMALFIEAYWRAVIAAGGLPVGLSLDLPAAESVHALDGILLTGGDDVDPGRYGATPHAETHADPLRDMHEFDLLEQAKLHDIPVLCICRGVQVANVFFGGTLHQHLPAHADFDKPLQHVHGVEFVADSALRAMYGESVDVNSLQPSGHRPGRRGTGSHRGCDRWHSRSNRKYRYEPRWRAVAPRDAPDGTNRSRVHLAHRTGRCPPSLSCSTTAITLRTAWSGR